MFSLIKKTSCLGISRKQSMLAFVRLCWLVQACANVGFDSLGGVAKGLKEYRIVRFW